jgi:hypothetical protein
MIYMFEDVTHNVLAFWESVGPTNLKTAAMRSTRARMCRWSGFNIDTT